MDRKEMLYAFIKEEEYRPMKGKEIAALFCVPKKERAKFHALLDELVKEGKIVIDGSGRYQLPKENVNAGTFMATSKGFGFVRVEGQPDDIFIPESGCSNAYDGDEVMVQIYKDSKNGKRKEGQIIRILKRANTTVVGTFMRNKHYGFVVVDREKFTSDVYIPKGKTKEAETGEKVVVEITDFGSEEKSPEGVVTEILGHADDPGIDILSIVRGYGIPEEFPEEVLRELPHIPEKVDSTDIAGRMDLRDRMTVTIDGEDAKDLDDAITLHKEENGGYELGVHIADVSHYVKEGSPVDKEALNRGTSVYLADRVIPMLPRKLSNGICSLNQGMDRLTLSCIIHYDAKGHIKDYRIGESVICVDRRMSYTDVNAIVTDHDEKTMAEYEAFVPMFEQMKELAVILRTERKKQGSIDFDFPECKLILDDEGHPIDIVPYDRNCTIVCHGFLLFTFVKNPNILAK